MNFGSFFLMGWNHIIDFGAYDHILFITVLCAIFRIEEWKKILTIITAFTIGHSVTLALSSLDIIFIPIKLVEVLIPATIVFTSVSNILQKKAETNRRVFNKNVVKNYILAMLFGFIHGMGFASNFKFLLGDSANIVKQLLAFNLGIEAGQILVVLFILGIYFVLQKVNQFAHKEWNLFLSGAGFGVGVILLVTNLLNYKS